MEINIIAVAKIKEKYIQAGIEDFINRLQRFCDLNILEVKPEKIKSDLTGAQIEQVKTKEGQRILEKIPATNYIIALSVYGKPMSSDGLAKSLKNLQLKGQKKISFIIGGPLGLSEEVLNKVDYQLSLSHMTFTHQMIRLIFLEQIYRAFKIMNGEPYHK